MIHPIRALLAATALAAGLSVTTGAPVTAQQPKATPPASSQPSQPPQPVELTQTQIDGLVTAQPEIAKLMQSGNPKKPDPKVPEKVDAIAKKAGFAGADDLARVDATVETVLGGIDPETKTYVGPTALVRKEIARIEADKAMPAKNKAAALKELKAALAAGDPPQPSAGNVALVSKNLDKLTQAEDGR